jgi:hypothetical protein
VSDDQHDEIVAAVTKALAALTESGDTAEARDVITLAIYTQPNPETLKTLRRIKDYLNIDQGQKAKFHMEALLNQLTKE